jgi:hypothetical protein
MVLTKGERRAQTQCPNKDLEMRKVDGGRRKEEWEIERQLNATKIHSKIETKHGK